MKLCPVLVALEPVFAGLRPVGGWGIPETDQWVVGSRQEQARVIVKRDRSRYGLYEGLSRRKRSR